MAPATRPAGCRSTLQRGESSREDSPQHKRIAGPLARCLTTYASAASDPLAHALTYVPPLAIGGLHRTEPNPDALVGWMRWLGSAGPESSSGELPIGLRCTRHEIRVQTAKLLVGEMAEASACHLAHQGQITVAERLSPPH